MQAPVFNTGVPTADGYYLLKIFDEKPYFQTWKFHEGKWVNPYNEPNFENMPNYIWAQIPSLEEWSDIILDAPLGADILIIDEYGSPDVSYVIETESTPHKRQWRRGYENPGLWHIISAPLLENHENDNENNFNNDGRKAFRDGFRGRSSSEWYYAVQEMKRCDYSHYSDLDCDEDVDCMTPQQINDQLAAIEQLNLRIGNHQRDVIRGILPPPSYEWGSYADKKDWCNMILNLPYKLPEQLHGIPRELRDWCLEVARTLP